MVRRSRKNVSRISPLKKFIYLISPSKINKKFYNNLDAVLSYGNVKFFQLRLKKIDKNNLLSIASKIRKITSKHKVKFIINDKYVLVTKSKADGCHMGQLDGSIEIAKKKLRNLDKLSDDEFDSVFGSFSLQANKFRNDSHISSRYKRNGQYFYWIPLSEFPGTSDE